METEKLAEPQNGEPENRRHPNQFPLRQLPDLLIEAKCRFRYGFYKQGGWPNVQTIKILFSSYYSFQVHFCCTYLLFFARLNKVVLFLTKQQMQAHFVWILPQYRCQKGANTNNLSLPLLNPAGIL